MSTLFTDNFTRADSGTLGANYTDIDAGFGVSSNTAKAATAGLNSTIINAVSFPANQWVQVTLVGTMSTNSDEGAGVVLRGAAGGDLYFVHCSTVDSHLYKRVGGTYTDISGAQAAFALNDVLYAEVQGTTLLYKKNGTTVWSGTDSALSSGAAGLWGDSSTGLIAVDTLTAGDFGGGGATITPTAGALVISGSQPTVARSGGTTISPTAGALVLAGAQPSETLTLQAPGTGLLVLTGSQPTVLQGQLKQATAGALVLSGSQPTLSQAIARAPTAGALVIAGSQPQLSQAIGRTPTAGALSLSGSQPTLSITSGTTITPTAGALVIAGSQASVTATGGSNTTITPTNAALVIAGTVPAQTIGVLTGAGSLVISGGTLSLDLSKTPTAGALNLAGSQPSLRQDLTVTPSAGALVLSGSQPAIQAPIDYVITPGAGSMSVAANQPDINNSTVVFLDLHDGGKRKKGKDRELERAQQFKEKQEKRRKLLEDAINPPKTPQEVEKTALEPIEAANSLPIAANAEYVATIEPPQDTEAEDMEVIQAFLRHLAAEEDQLIQQLLKRA